MCANEYVYLGKLCAQMNHILSKMGANVLPPLYHLQTMEQEMTIKFCKNNILLYFFLITNTNSKNSTNKNNKLSRGVSPNN